MGPPPPPPPPPPHANAAAWGVVRWAFRFPRSVFFADKRFVRKVGLRLKVFLDWRDDA